MILTRAWLIIKIFNSALGSALQIWRRRNDVTWWHMMSQDVTWYHSKSCELIMWHNFRHHITPEKNQLIFPFGSYSWKNPNSTEDVNLSAYPWKLLKSYQSPWCKKSRIWNTWTRKSYLGHKTLCGWLQELEFTLLNFTPEFLKEIFCWFYHQSFSEQDFMR